MIYLSQQTVVEHEDVSYISKEDANTHRPRIRYLETRHCHLRSRKHDVQTTLQSV